MDPILTAAAAESTRRITRWAVGLAAAALPLLVVLGMILMGAMGGVIASSDQSTTAAGACPPPVSGGPVQAAAAAPLPQAATPSASATSGVPLMAGKPLTAEQRQIAATVVATGREMNVPQRGLVVALMTAAQESQLKNLDYGDRDSLGVFQQRPSQGWGTPAQIRDPAYAARKFFQSLLRVPGWQQMTLNDAAQAVQRSGFPDAYGQWQSLAEALVGGSGTDVAPQCTVPDVAPVAGNLTAPLDPGYVITSEFGMRYHPIRHTQRLHAGTDFGTPIGTPVRSVMGGTVVTVAFDPGGWGNYVVIAHPGGVDSLYGHLSSASVAVGATVKAGQVVALSGNTGGSTGPHLHLEIRPGSNGAAMGRPTNPRTWFAAQGHPL